LGYGLRPGKTWLETFQPILLENSSIILFVRRLNCIHGLEVMMSRADLFFRRHTTTSGASANSSECREMCCHSMMSASFILLNLSGARGRIGNLEPFRWGRGLNADDEMPSWRD
jgi:hypothetical protein